MLYIEEHKGCRNYDLVQKPVMECRRMKKGISFHIRLKENKILFILKGVFFLAFGDYTDTVKEGQMVVLPGGSNYIFEAQEEVTYIICRLRNNLPLCDQFSIENLFNENTACDSPCCPLEFNRMVAHFIHNLEEYLKDDIRCSYFFELKTKEFFFLLRNYYTREELQRFFHPLISHDLAFSDFVLKNHRKVRNVTEFAELANYSVSGFEKRFKKVFQVPAYKWMKEQRAKDILHEIHYSNKSFKEIGWDYGFSSPAQFNDFCKSNFNKTPGQLRQKLLQPVE